MRVITFSTKFPAKHPRKGEPTYFIEKVWKYFLEKSSPVFPYWMNKHELKIDIRNCYDFDPKHHTIRAGNRWKVGDKFSPRIWSGQPYRSKQIQFALDIEIKKIWEFEITKGAYLLNGNELGLAELTQVAKNDGLTVGDFEGWFMSHPRKKEGSMKAQILCWNESIEYP